jgi:hypothetical protein
MKQRIMFLGRDWRVWVLALLALIALACEGNGGTTGSGEKPSSKPEKPLAIVLPGGLCTVHVSRPYVSARPRSSGPNLFRFAVTGEADVACTEQVDVIELTAILHHRTNAHAGAFKGRSHQCESAKFCNAEVEFWRDGLNCGEFYSYEDYVQLVGSYRRAAGSVPVRIDVESRATTGSAHFPPGACGKEA